MINDVAPPPPPVQEGILLPPPRPTNDASGRIFLIFVDDLHMDFRNTGRIRELFKKISKELVHEGDMFGIVSTRPLVDRHRRDLRSQAPRRGDQQDLGRRPEARRDHHHARRLAGSARSALSRARRLLDRLRHPGEVRADPQPPQGVHLRQRRLRLRSVLEVAGQGSQPALLGHDRRPEQQHRQRRQQRYRHRRRHHAVHRHQSVLEAGQRVRRGRSRRRAQRADARRQSRQHRRSTPSTRAAWSADRISTRPSSTWSTGRITSAKRRAACA